LGLEHEYSLTRAGQPVDFRALIHSLSIDGLRIDPADTNAYRCANGMALTCDEAEAEVASPPIALAPGFGAALVAWAAAGRSMLDRVLPPDVTATGYSTHISVAMPDELNDEACDLFARTFGPAVALLLDGPDSLGIYVRPRPGRLEVCGEFVDGARLGAAAAFVAGAARVCAASLTGGAVRLPPLLDCELLPGVERYGLRLHRHSAFGFDYYRPGRAALLPLGTGATVSAQALLERAWASARSHLESLAVEEDMASMDAVVAGRLPLGVEGGFPPALAPGSLATSPFCELARPHRRPGVELGVVAATWDTVVVRAARAGDARYLTLPRNALGEFFTRLDSGVLDEPLAGAFANAAEPAPRSAAQLRTFGVYSTAPDPSLLVAPERDPGAQTGGGAKAGRPGKRGGPSAARPGKLASPSRPFKFVPLPFSEPAAMPGAPAPLPLPVPPVPLPPSRPAPTVAEPPPPVAPPKLPPWRPSPLAVVLVAGAAAVAVAVGALAVFYDSGNGGEPTPTATSTSTATATVTVAAVVTTPTPPAPTATSSPTVKPSETATQPASPSPTATKAAETVTPGAAATQTPTPHPTDIVPATFTPTPSPTPTRTPTATATPTRTATKAPTPTATKGVIVVGCTPSPGTTCLTPVP
jgi:hypothetical protein